MQLEKAIEAMQRMEATPPTWEDFAAKLDRTDDRPTVRVPVLTRRETVYGDTTEAK